AANKRKIAWEGRFPASRANKNAARPRSTGARRAPEALLVSSQASGLEHDDRSNRLAAFHQVKALVDLVQRQGVGDQIIDIDFAIHVPVHDTGNIGTATRPAE